MILEFAQLVITNWLRWKLEDFNRNLQSIVVWIIGLDILRRPGGSHELHLPYLRQAGAGDVKILDLFCKAGGAAMGLHRAIPEAKITGVDIEPQPNYPFEFVKADALKFLLYGYDFIWASPPCQAYSITKVTHGKKHPELVGPIRDRLRAAGVPYIIENVVGAPLIDPILLCGSSFGLQVWRHRIFECSGFYCLRPDCMHWSVPYPIDVTGTGGSKQTVKGQGRISIGLKNAQAAMGIDWMTKAELSQAIPPAYSEYLARHWKSTLKSHPTDREEK